MNDKYLDNDLPNSEALALEVFSLNVIVTSLLRLLLSESTDAKTAADELIFDCQNIVSLQMLPDPPITEFALALMERVTEIVTQAKRALDVNVSHLS